MRLAKEIALWVICLFLAYVFFRAGIAKFSDTSGWAQAFRYWGYPVWFRIMVGIMELAAVALVLHPRTASLGALVIMIVMLGGMGTHVATGRPRQVTSEIFPLTLATVVCFSRRKEMFPLRGRARAMTA